MDYNPARDEKLSPIDLCKLTISCGSVLNRVRPVRLSEASRDVPQFEALLAPYASEKMICWPASPRVGVRKTATRA
jgi:hypothetical protein